MISGKPSANGTWLHTLAGHDNAARCYQTPLAPHSNPPSRRRASVDRLNLIYSTLLANLKLSDMHLNHLRGRGLSPDAININCYRDTPAEEHVAALVRVLEPLGLDGVPGFFCRGTRWKMVRCYPGFFVPYRDSLGRIQAMQYRLDAPPEGSAKYLWFSSRDCSSGTPVHHACHSLLADAEDLTIVEGGLKADLCAYFLGAPVIGIAGVSCFGEGFADLLRQSAPRLKRAIVAFDRDFVDKPEVFAALMRLSAHLEEAAFDVRVRTWPRGAKGLDDHLLGEFRAQVGCTL